MDAKRQINVRISEELYAQIETAKGSKQDIISDALMLYFDSNGTQDLAKDLEHCREKNRLLDSNIRDLQGQIGFLQLEYQKLTDRVMLPASKAWWQFWKK